MSENNGCEDVEPRPDFDNINTHSKRDSLQMETSDQSKSFSKTNDGLMRTTQNTWQKRQKKKSQKVLRLMNIHDTDSDEDTLLVTNRI